MRDPRLLKQDPHTPRYACAEVSLDQPVAHLDYGNMLLQAQDSLTNCVAVDLYCDLHIHTTQPTANTLVFDTVEDRTVAMLYMGRYDSFTVYTT